MAKTDDSPKNRKAELSGDLERARAAIGRALEGFQHDFSLGTQLKQSVGQHKTLWLSGAALAGLALFKASLNRRRAEKSTPVSEENAQKPWLSLFGRTENRKSSESIGLLLAAASVLGALLKPTLTTALHTALNTAVKPAVTAFLTKQLSAWVKGRGRF